MNHQFLICDKCGSNNDIKFFKIESIKIPNIKIIKSIERLNIND